ncbi:MAG: hypothetical protein MUO72_05395 [Bacteroidales bacterium]|nr:hypothetical protein [Bacteroidales bacterium]
MKKFILLAAILLSLIACNQKNIKNPDFAEITNAQFIDSTDMTNNFYDNSETYSLIVKELTVEGEIANPGKVDFTQLSKHSVIVKETLLDSVGGDRFTGAFRYDGYSLFDILEKRIIRKTNAEEFSPIIDLYIEIENDKGDKVVFSWGEIYYPNNLHKIIIATGVSRIVPSRTKDLWVLPGESKIIAAGDLITERNISSPVRITVKSFPKSFNVVKGMSPMYSSKIILFENQKPVGEISSVSKIIKTETFKTIFYGRGKGIHSTSPFTGILLNEILQAYFPVSRSSLKSGIMCIVGQDGYRSAISYSELFNRNDQQEFLLVETAPGEDGGLFRIFAASDFFSDRAVKSVIEIHLGF